MAGYVNTVRAIVCSELPAREASNFWDFWKLISCDFIPFISSLIEIKLLFFYMCLLRINLPNMCPNMNHFDAVDFSECHSEEVISFFWRSVYMNKLDWGAEIQCLDKKFKALKQNLFFFVPYHQFCRLCKTDWMNSLKKTNSSSTRPRRGRYAGREKWTPADHGEGDLFSQTTQESQMSSRDYRTHLLVSLLTHPALEHIKMRSDTIILD